MRKSIEDKIVLIHTNHAESIQTRIDIAVSSNNSKNFELFEIKQNCEKNIVLWFKRYSNG